MAKPKLSIAKATVVYLDYGKEIERVEGVAWAASWRYFEEGVTVAEKMAVFASVSDMDLVEVEPMYREVETNPMGN